MKDQKTMQQAFDNLNKEVSILKSAILESLPEWIYSLARFIHKYRIAPIVFQVLAIVYLVIGEYPSALITAVISLYFVRKRK